MTRKSRRELEQEIGDLKADDDDLGEIEVSSTVVTITEDMTDERGGLVDEVTVPDDATVLPTGSDVVTVWSTTE
jgi:hypothetical protein